MGKPWRGMMLLLVLDCVVVESAMVNEVVEVSVEERREIEEEGFYIKKASKSCKICCRHIKVQKVRIDKVRICCIKAQYIIYFLVISGPGHPPQGVIKRPKFLAVVFLWSRKVSSRPSQLDGLLSPFAVLMILAFSFGFGLSRSY